MPYGDAGYCTLFSAWMKKAANGLESMQYAMFIEKTLKDSCLICAGKSMMHAAAGTVSAIHAVTCHSTADPRMHSHVRIGHHPGRPAVCMLQCRSIAICQVLARSWSFLEFENIFG